MRNVTPDWLLNLTWFAAGISATGALWYFLSQRNYHASLWAKCRISNLLRPAHLEAVSSRTDP